MSNLHAIQDHKTRPKACPHCVARGDPDKDLRCAFGCKPAAARFYPDDTRLLRAQLRREAIENGLLRESVPGALGSPAQRAARAAQWRSRAMTARASRAVTTEASGPRVAARFLPAASAVTADWTVA